MERIGDCRHRTSGTESERNGGRGEGRGDVNFVAVPIGSEEGRAWTMAKWLSQTMTLAPGRPCRQQASTADDTGKV